MRWGSRLLTLLSPLGFCHRHTHSNTKKSSKTDYWNTSNLDSSLPIPISNPVHSQLTRAVQAANKSACFNPALSLLSWAHPMLPTRLKTTKTTSGFHVVRSKSIPLNLSKQSSQLFLSTHTLFSSRSSIFIYRLYYSIYEILNSSLVNFKIWLLSAKCQGTRINIQYQ